jgi:hypothetical protein
MGEKPANIPIPGFKTVKQPRKTRARWSLARWNAAQMAQIEELLAPHAD